jgi:hypothetical protein
MTTSAPPASAAAEFKGDVPVIKTERWLTLNPAERRQHVKSELIKVEPQCGRASSGRVTVKVYRGARSRHLGLDLL